MNIIPIIELKLTQTEKIPETLGWIAVIGIWILTLLNYFELPEVIPTHYNGSGIADGFGNKANILSLPIVSTIMFVGMTILNKYPHVFNHPSIITAQNALHHYTNATRMIRYLKLAIVIIFGLIVFKTIQNANGNADGLGTWFLPLTMELIFIIIFLLMLVKSRRK